MYVNRFRMVAIEYTHNKINLQKFVGFVHRFQKICRSELAAETVRRSKGKLNENNNIKSTFNYLQYKFIALRPGT